MTNDENLCTTSNSEPNKRDNNSESCRKKYFYNQKDDTYKLHLQVHVLKYAIQMFFLAQYIQLCFGTFWSIFMAE